MKIFSGLAAGWLALISSLQAEAAPAAPWQAQSIYQIITDRFYDGDPSNNNADGNYDPAGHSGRSVHGGDFKGIEQKLDYVKALGATAIWISPVVLNGRGEFHGYAGRDFYKVDPHWGTMADLQQMVAAAHARGLLVIDDIVANHGGNLLTSDDPGYPAFKYPDGYKLRFRNPERTYPPPFDLNAAHPALTDLFHNYGVTKNYKNATEVELGSLAQLDDFKTESPYVRDQMIQIYKYWIEQAGFDGFRIDTVKHVDMPFWEAFCPAIRQFAAAHGKPDFFMFGEVLTSSESKCGSYIGPDKLDSVLDYPLFEKVNSVFGRADGNTRQVEEHYTAIASNYAAPARMRLVTFLDNHDQPRFLSRGVANNNTDHVKVALTFLYTARGIPCLYYGTEQAFNGATDPYDREDMFAGQFEWGPSRGDNFNMTHPLFQFVARLNNFRRLYPVLETGDHINLWNNPKGPGLLAYARRREAQEIIVVLNTSSAVQTLPPRRTTYAPGTTLVDLLDSSNTIQISSGPKTPPITVPGTSARIFIAQAQVRPLDPVVAAVSPAHDSHDVAPGSPVEIQFNEAMDTANVESAFSIRPVVEGVFSWSPGRDKVTFTPKVSLPAQTSFTIRIGEYAKAATSGNHLYAAFESIFQVR
jgi:alpha-amylase